MVSDRSRRLEARTEPRITFLGEQDGPPEAELKAAIAAELRSWPRAERAYLARVGYDAGGDHEVALCIAGAEDRRLVQKVSAVFQRLFASDTHMDVLFLTSAQEAELSTVCRPFYE